MKWYVEVINVSMPNPHIKNPFITLRWFSRGEKTPIINDKSVKGVLMIS